MAEQGPWSSEKIGHCWGSTEKHKKRSIEVPDMSRYHWSTRNIILPCEGSAFYCLALNENMSTSLWTDAYSYDDI